jgi:hypothetical protein
MSKKLELILGYIRDSDGKKAIRVTRILYLGNKIKDVKSTDGNERVGDKYGIGLEFLEREINGKFKTCNQIELSYDNAVSFIDLIKNSHYHNPADTFRWDSLLEIPDWLYYNEDDFCWWHEKPPEDVIGKWIKYKDYLRKQME